MTTPVHCNCGLCVEADDTLGKPWTHISGQDYDELQDMEREAYENNSRFSPSKTRSTRQYFLEYCRESLTKHGEIPKDTCAVALVKYCFHKSRLFHLARRYLRVTAKSIERYNAPGKGEGLSTHWQLFVARAQNLWPVIDEATRKGRNQVFSQTDYYTMVLEIANEFHFRDERLTETYPDGYETHGESTPDVYIPDLSLDDQEVQQQLGEKQRQGGELEPVEEWLSKEEEEEQQPEGWQRLGGSQQPDVEMEDTERQAISGLFKLRSQ
ncbi:hypothetical protein AJ79_04388 [Helicocarpus griseus UAMH5409]|uniref:Uncharacterized protein n=1 Tax=Helicocarpus griseus UAMH5409 TaxID=1447875 RepID=A0A2B7XTB9_9EURO|nr:hypothetical protein AJ79_04388 [Helicocarpus griseus UAMH5409]